MIYERHSCHDSWLIDLCADLTSSSVTLVNGDGGTSIERPLIKRAEPEASLLRMNQWSKPQCPARARPRPTQVAGGIDAGSVGHWMWHATEASTTTHNRHERHVVSISSPCCWSRRAMAVQNTRTDSVDMTSIIILDLATHTAARARPNTVLTIKYPNPNPNPFI